MAVQIDPGRRDGPLAAITVPIAVAGGCLMLACAILVCVSVLMRWIIGYGVPGDYEYLQVSIAAAAFAFLPVCQGRRGNIMVTTFTSGLPPWARDGLDCLWDLTYAAFAALIAWRLTLGGLEAIANRTTEMVTGFPTGYVIMLAACLMALLALVTLATAALIWRRARTTGSPA